MNGTSNNRFTDGGPEFVLQLNFNYITVGAQYFGKNRGKRGCQRADSVRLGQNGEPLETGASCHSSCVGTALPRQYMVSKQLTALQIPVATLTRERGLLRMVGLLRMGSPRRRNGGALVAGASEFAVSVALLKPVLA